jgi:hypothetical protein
MIGGGGISEANLMEYLGIIEQRTNEVLQMYAAVQMHKPGTSVHESLVTILGKGPSVSAGSVKITIKPPRMRDASSDTAPAGAGSDCEEEDLEDDRPLSRHELRAKALLRVQRQTESGGSEGGGLGGDGVHHQAHHMDAGASRAPHSYAALEQGGRNGKKKSA